MDLSAVRSLGAAPLTGLWFCVIEPAYWARCTNTRYTRQTHSRFSPGSDGNPPFETLYLGESADVISLECSLCFLDRRTNHTFPNPDAGTQIVAAADVVLQRIVDLTLLQSMLAIQTSVQELTGDWVIFNSIKRRPHLISVPPLAPTQQLGQELFGVPQLEGFKTFSAKKPECLCLIVFPEKLLKGSSISFRNGADPPKILRGKR